MEKETLKSVLAIARNYKKIVLTFPTMMNLGGQIPLDFGNILFSRKIPFAVAEIPNKYKDIWIIMQTKTDRKTKFKRNTFPLQNQRKKEDFKKFAYKAARIMDRAELAEMFNNC